MRIEMTGREDRLSPWKYAIGGFPGSGKTLLASTAPKPLFVFFRENPRIKSIADRFIPHVKVLNDDEATVLEKMQALTAHLSLQMDTEDPEYKTLVVDTGDELFQSMKEARRIRNGGEFTASDWGWLGDTYRELMVGLVDLPMRVIVLFHVKSSFEDEQSVVREILLQGSAKDEVAGWFDVVGALDTFEAEEEGELVTKRVLLTHSSRLYPWVKDHSGNLPRRYFLSENFVGDVSAIELILNSTDITSDHEVLAEISSVAAVPGGETAVVITPEQLEAAKHPDTAEINAALDVVAEVLEIAEISDPSPEDQPEAATVDAPDPAPELPLAEEEEDITEPQPEQPSSEEPATPDVTLCEVCGQEAPNDVLTVSRIRFKKVLCREHFREQLDAAEK